jgi:hypothetical protein
MEIILSFGQEARILPFKWVKARVPITTSDSLILSMSSASVTALLQYILTFPSDLIFSSVGLPVTTGGKSSGMVIRGIIPFPLLGFQSIMAGWIHII